MQITITPKKDGVSSLENSVDVLTQQYAMDVTKTMYGRDPRRAPLDDKNKNVKGQSITAGVRYTRTTDDCFYLEHTGLDKVYAIVTVNELGDIVFKSATGGINVSGDLVLEKNPSSADDSSVKTLAGDLEAFLNKMNIAYERKTQEQ